MKKIIFILFLNLIVGGAFAQSKEELKKQSEKEKKKLTKEWGKKLKKVDPMEFKALYESYTVNKAEQTKLTRQLTEMGKELEKKEKTAQKLQVEIDSIRSSASGRNMAKEADEVDVANNDEFKKGLVFKVQVVPPNSAQFKAETLEKGIDGKLRYTLGAFRRYEDADQFKVRLRKMGLKDSKVEAYNNNAHMKMEDALPLYKYRTENAEATEGE